MLAGLGAGMTEGIFVTPFERTKVHLQAMRHKMSEVSVGNFMLVCVVACLNIVVGIHTICKQIYWAVHQYIYSQWAF